MIHAAAAVKTDGTIIEVHTHPDQSVSDAAQAISRAMFADLMVSLRKIASTVDMKVQPSFNLVEIG